MSSWFISTPMGFAARRSGSPLLFRHRSTPACPDRRRGPSIVAPAWRSRQRSRWRCSPAARVSRRRSYLLAPAAALDLKAVVGHAGRRHGAVRPAMGPFATVGCAPATGVWWRRSAGSCSVLWRCGPLLTPLVGYGLMTGQRLLPLPLSACCASRCRPSAGAGSSAIPTRRWATRRQVCCTCPPACRWTWLSTARHVIHSLWIPRLAANTDAIPGDASTLLRLEADVPGSYQAQCAEFCGQGTPACALMLWCMRKPITPRRLLRPRGLRRSSHDRAHRSCVEPPARCACTAS